MGPGLELPGATGLAAATVGAMAAWQALLALGLDRWLGEPPARWHPVVWMGRWLGLYSRWLPSLPARAAFWAGTLAWWGGAALVLAVAWALEATLQTWPTWAPPAWEAPGPLASLPWLGSASQALALLLGALALKPLLAWRMLRDEVGAVELALRHSLEAGRAQLARLVSRDTTTLGPTAVREAAIETLAENLNDSVVAPLFWFAIAGLPGAALYRYANTADAMWGYRGRWEWAGKWAARADDVLSWLPARLTAGLLCLAAGRWPGLARLRALAAHTPSPNGGWPMGAMAWLLGCQLGKPGVYLLNETGHLPTAPDHALALQWAGRVVALLALGAAVGATVACIMAALPSRWNL